MWPCQDSLVFSVLASHLVGHGFKTRPGHTKDHQKMVQTASLLYMYVLGMQALG